MRYTGTVTSAGLAKIRAEVEKLNKRAAKLNLEPLKIDVLDKREVEAKNAAGWPVTKIVYDIALIGTKPCISGWTPVASIEFTPGGNLVNVAPDAELKNDYRDCSNRCDHCKTIRNRTDVVVMQKGDEEMMIGRNCLADFLRGEETEGMIEFLNWLANLPPLMSGDPDDDYRDIRGGEAVDNLVDYLIATRVIVRRYGFIGRTKAAESGATPTTDYVSTLLHPWSKEQREWIEREQLVANEQDKEVANKVIEWALEIEDTREYLQNLRVIAKNGYVGRKHQGYAASMLTAYLRAQDELRKAEDRADKQAELTQIGEPKQRLRDLRVTVVRVRFTENEWGVTTIVTFRLPGNVDLTWFATGDQSEVWVEGEEYIIDCTVKEHLEDPKWGRSTRVNRVRGCLCTELSTK